MTKLIRSDAILHVGRWFLEQKLFARTIKPVLTSFTKINHSKNYFIHFPTRTSEGSKFRGGGKEKFRGKDSKSQKILQG